MKLENANNKVNKKSNSNIILDKNDDIEFKSNPQNIMFSRKLTTDSYAHSESSLERFNNTFCIFHSIENLFYLIYTNCDNSIICYNIIDDKKVIEIKNAHNTNITNFIYYYDKTNKRDLVLSISNNDSSIKLWNINIWECLISITNIYINNKLYSSCFLNDNNILYIITTNYLENVKVFNLYGQIIKEIKSIKYNYIIISYYDKKLSKNFIITGNEGKVTSYDYKENKVYQIYCDNDNSGHYNVIINDKEEIIKLIESNSDGLIKIWNFHTVKLLMKINVDSNRLYGLCLWNKDYLFAGSLNGSLKLIDIKNGKIIKDLNGHNNFALTIKKIIHPIFRECLISQGSEDDQIRLWN